MGDQQDQYLAVKNWDKYQTKLKNGKENLDWIKVRTDRVDDPEYAALTFFQRGLLTDIMEYSGRQGKWVKNKVTFIAQATHALPTDRPHIGHAILTIMSHGFLILCNQQKIGESAIEERRGEEKRGEFPPTPHTPSHQGGKEEDMGADWKSQFREAFGRRQIKDRPETWTKLRALIKTYKLPDVLDAFRRFLATGYVGEYPIAAFLPAAEGLIQVGESAAPSGAYEGSQGPAKPTGPDLADELAQISKLDIVFGSSQRLALSILEAKFGRPDMLLAFRAFMGNLKDEKDLKFAAKNFVEQAPSYVHVLCDERKEAERNKTVLAEAERKGTEKREQMKQELAEQAALQQAEDDELMKDLGVA